MTKWVYLAFALFTPLLVAGSRAGLFSFDVQTATVVFALVPLLKGAVGLKWLHEAWSSVPAAERHLKDGSLVTPGGAVGRMFIPVYGFYWTFAANTALCAAIDRVLSSAGRGRATDASMAQVAAAGNIALIASSALPPLFAVGAAAVVSGFWFAYMYQTDRARGYMDDVLRRAEFA
jgi:hypothetical protein